MDTEREKQIAEQAGGAAGGAGVRVACADACALSSNRRASAICGEG